MANQELTSAADEVKAILEYISQFDPEDIDGDSVDLRFEDLNGRDVGCDVSIVEQCKVASKVIAELTYQLEDKPSKLEEMIQQDRAKDELIKFLSEKLATAEDTIRQTSAANAQLKMTLEDMQHVCAESYQVVGTLAYEFGIIEKEKVQKALDNLSNCRMLHDDVLPFIIDNSEYSYFDSLVADAKVRAKKAMEKFPQPNYVLNKVSEESGEVVKAVIHYIEGRETWKRVEDEVVDNLAMLIRLMIEGDEVIGFIPGNKNIDKVRDI